MAGPARKVATYEDVLAAPPHMVAEIVDGDLVLSPRPVSRQAAAAAVLGEVELDLAFLWADVAPPATK